MTVPSIAIEEVNDAINHVLVPASWIHCSKVEIYIRQQFDAKIGDYGNCAGISRQDRLKRAFEANKTVSPIVVYLLNHMADFSISPMGMFDQ